MLGLLWAASLGLPAVGVVSGPDLNGLDLLRLGWRGAEVGVYAWYSNPLFLGALIAAVFRHPVGAGVASGAGLLLALTSFAASSLAENAGAAAPELSFGTGFYVWLSAQVGLCLWCWADIFRRVLAGNGRNLAPESEFGVDRPDGPP